jgi:hypothetical protein
MTPAELLWRTAPNATLDFLVEPGPQTTRGIGFAARILAERGILPGSILLAGLPAWLLVFETFLDPFHVWCSLSVPIYLTGANSILFMGGTVWDGLRFRSGEVSLGERAAFMRDAILLRRAVSRARKNIVLPALARGLERGLSQNHYLRTQHGRIAGLPPWIQAFASGSQWADFASPQDIVSGPRSQNGVFGLDGALVFGENIRGNEERAFLWREMIAGVAQTRDWVALRLTGLADSNEISRNDFILAQWRLGKIAAILNQIEILGLLQIAERERGESRVPDLLGRAFNLLRQINLAIGNSTELVATREQIQNEIRALRHEIREEIRANACEKKIIGN